MKNLTLNSELITAKRQEYPKREVAKYGHVSHNGLRSNVLENTFIKRALTSLDLSEIKEVTWPMDWLE